MCWRKSFYRSQSRQEQQGRQAPLPRISVTALPGWTCESLPETLYPDCTASLARPSQWLLLAPKIAVYKNGQQLYSWAENITVWILLTTTPSAVSFCSFSLPSLAACCVCYILDTSCYFPSPYFCVLNSIALEDTRGKHLASCRSKPNTCIRVCLIK